MHCINFYDFNLFTLITSVFADTVGIISVTNVFHSNSNTILYTISNTSYSGSGTSTFLRVGLDASGLDENYTGASGNSISTPKRYVGDVNSSHTI